MKYFVFFVIAMMTLTSCAGYRFQSKTNPFAQYSIKSISIPMFYNKSNFSNVSGKFTREIYSTLLDFKDLKLSSGLKNSDAVLIGIIVSNKYKRDSVSAISSKSVENTFGKNAIGKQRDDFLVTSVNRVQLGLRIIVVKHPTREEIEFLQSNLGETALSSKIIFNETIPLQTTYQLKELKGDASKVIGSQNRGAKEQKIGELATLAGNRFRDMILYAF